MTLRFGRDNTAETRVSTRLDVLEDALHSHIVSDLIPRVKEHNRIAIIGDPVAFLYYQRRSFGRRCACWRIIDSGPDKRCPLCFGVGIVTGYNKYGCIWECIDTTSPNLVMVNVAPDWAGQHRPAPFCLTNDAVRGFIETTIQIRPIPAKDKEGNPHTDILDLLSVLYHEPQGTRVILYVKTSTESDFTEVTAGSVIEDRLKDTDGNPTSLTFRLLLARGRSSKSPSVVGLHLRYRTNPDPVVNLDIPRDADAIALSELGVYDQQQVGQCVMDTTISEPHNLDFIVRVRDSRRFKFIEITTHKPAGIHVGTEAQIRRVQEYDSYIIVP